MLFARKDGIVSSLQSKYGSGTVAMSINDSACWLSRVNLAVAIIMIGWGLSVILTQPVTRWFATSSAVWMALLLMSAIWQLRGSFIAIAALALATAVVSRLFSILRLNPPASTAGLRPDDLDLLVATGPGVPGFAILGWFLGALVLVQFMMRAAAVVASSDSREVSLNELALTFIRVYVGLMLVPHFGSHILGGPFQFKIYTLYFDSLGIYMPAIQVALAGSIELISAVGLIGIFHPPGCRTRIRVFADVDAVGRTFSDRLCVGAARGGLRICCVLGGNDRRVRCARRRPAFARQLWRSEPARRLLPKVVWEVLAS
jgi:putative oxidoreductase